MAMFTMSERRGLHQVTTGRIINLNLTYLSKSRRCDSKHYHFLIFGFIESQFNLSSVGQFYVNSDSDISAITNVAYTRNTSVWVRFPTNVRVSFRWTATHITNTWWRLSWIMWWEVDAKGLPKYTTGRVAETGAGWNTRWHRPVEILLWSLSKERRRDKKETVACRGSAMSFHKNTTFFVAIFASFDGRLF